MAFSHPLRNWGSLPPRSFVPPAMPGPLVMPHPHGGVPGEFSPSSSPGAAGDGPALQRHALLPEQAQCRQDRQAQGGSRALDGPCCPLDPGTAPLSLIPASSGPKGDTLGWPHVLGTFSCQEGSQLLHTPEESLGRGCLRAHVPSGGDTAGVDPLGWVPPPRGARLPQLTPQPWATPACQPVLWQAGVPELPWSTRTILPGCQENGGQHPHAQASAATESQATPLLHTSSLCKLPEPHWPPLSSHPHRPGDAEGFHPTHPAHPMPMAPRHRASPVQPDHRCQSWTAVRRVPSPRQPPSPSAGCLPVTRRLAMGDFSQLGMKS